MTMSSSRALVLQQHNVSALESVLGKLYTVFRNFDASLSALWHSILSRTSESYGRSPRPVTSLFVVGACPWYASS